MENIKLALQKLQLEMDIWNGHLNWVPPLSMQQIFRVMAWKRMGWSSYRDKRYVHLLLQYYAFGRESRQAHRVSVGYVRVLAHGKGKGGTTYTGAGMDLGSRVRDGVPYLCHGVPDPEYGLYQSGPYSKFSLCSDGVKWFGRLSRFQDASYTPAAGDVIFFDWETWND